METKPDLWAHQKRDIQRILDSPSLLNFSDPGTGKTRVCIEAVEQLGLPVLVVAPKSILTCAWAHDFDSYAPNVTYSVATAKNRAAAFRKDTQVVITNHDAVTWLRHNMKYGDRFRKGVMIVDESTSMKTPKAMRSKACVELRNTFFEYAICMSGTPTPQGIIDIWNQAYIVDKGKRLGSSYFRFKNLCYTPQKRGVYTEWTEKPGVAEAIMDLLSDITIRNRRQDCMDLPEHQLVERFIDLSPTHMRKYNELKRNAMVELESGEVNAVNAAVLLNKLLQLASGAVYDEHGAAHVVDTDRYELVMDLVEERSHSLVVFNWRHQRDQLIKLAEKRKIPHAVVDGSVTGDKRNRVVDEFQEGKHRVLFIHPKSAGHGLTLTRGVATIWASPTFDAELFEQANARIYRGGQTEKTETILISAAGTVDQSTYAALNNKRLNMMNLLELV